jgi:hypothetical protein
MTLLRKLLDGWIALAGRFGAVQTLVMLGLFYFALVGPMAIGARLAGRDLLDKRKGAADETAWRDADTAAPDLERAQRMT